MMHVKLVGWCLTVMGGMLLLTLGAPRLAIVVGGSVLALGGFFCGWGEREGK